MVPDPAELVTVIKRPEPMLHCGMRSNTIAQACMQRLDAALRILPMLYAACCMLPQCSTVLLHLVDDVKDDIPFVAHVGQPDEVVVRLRV